ncbi:hypothetical protein ABTX81_06370 [Kitasatospora sp. NPDC097605]|uniref:hypothetical protein n=1 Tax=Kitasatospora sp. NPDC097605 TaxID=3157226 RepID=UPI00331B3211
MTQMTRHELERLTAFLTERIGAPRESGDHAGQVEPLRRQLRHSVTGIDAYLLAAESDSPAAVHLREAALDLWQGLQRLAEAWVDTPAPPAPEAAAALGADVPAAR